MGDNKLIVNTLNGPIKGKNYETVFGKEILAFHRIPYIKTPTGSLRFKDPQPVTNWSEVLDCSLPPIPSLNKNVMLLKHQAIFEGDETAIHINAYTANLTPDKLRPVMVFIHGGCFISDSGSTRSYSPDFLLEKDIILFTFNYRLGVLGFLSLDDPNLEVPGNAGLKDQTMALRWIQNNCDRFGGDPNNITIFGESAGGASVHFHTISELSRGLFHKAIVMSGTATSPCSTIHIGNRGLKLAKLLGWDESEPTEKALEVLQNASGMELLKVVDQLIPPEQKLEIFEPFLPCVEPYVSEQCFISRPVTEMMEDPWSINIPVIMSATSNEGLVLGLLKSLVRFDGGSGSFQAFLPKDLASNNAARKTEFISRLKQLYYGDEQPSANNYDRFINLISDIFFMRSIHQVIQSRLCTCNPLVPTYLLRFAFDSKRFNHFKVCVVQMSNMAGACHADDLSYLFKNDNYDSTGGLPRDSREFKTMQRMVDLYTNFASTSNPNGGEIDGTTWEPLKSNNLPYKCLNVGDDLEFIDWPENERMKVWEQLYADDLN